LDSKEDQKNIIEKLFNSSSLEKYINVLDLYYDMDYKTFREIIEYNLIKEFKTFCDNNYIELRSIIPNEILQQRLELLFTSDSFIFWANEQKDDFGKYINEMIRNFPKNKIKENGRFQGTFSHTNVDRPYAINCVYPKNFILNLLANKQSKLIKEANKTKFNPESDFDFSNCNFDEPFKMLEIPQDKDSCLNNLEYFSKINSIIIDSRVFRFTLDSTNAFKELESIEKEISVNKSIDLSDGL